MNVTEQYVLTHKHQACDTVVSRFLPWSPRPLCYVQNTLIMLSDKLRQSLD